jgi:hypothetical protein
MVEWTVFLVLEQKAKGTLLPGTPSLCLVPRGNYLTPEERFGHRNVDPSIHFPRKSSIPRAKLGANFSLQE